MLPLLRAAALAAVLFSPAALFAAEPRVLPHDAVPNDVRLQPLKELDGYFPFDPPATLPEWQVRRAKVKQQLQVALGLWPLPEVLLNTPNALIRVIYEGDDYTVSAITLSTPGWPDITGNLYEPKGPWEGLRPGILCPYGHWPNGRFMDAAPAEVEKQLASGAEKFVNAARSPIQARCVQLARLGCVVLHYDMVGRADNTQVVGDDVAHLFKQQRPAMNRPDGWGLYSPRAEANLQNVMGWQTGNGILALNYLSQRIGVDANRLAITGASGGATQTMMVAALDDRVRAAFPAVMVSTAMQGGCTCENASCLRINTGNVEFASLFAPKPMAMTSANDWTKEMETKGFPQMKKLWALYGAPDAVQLTALIQYPHNYNAPSRMAMYQWFNRSLGLGRTDAELEEHDFHRLTRGELSVQVRPLAAGASPASLQPPSLSTVRPRLSRPGSVDDGTLNAEESLLKMWHASAQHQIRSTDANLRRYAPTGLEVVLGRSLAEAGQPTWEVTSKEENADFFTITGLIRNAHGEELPALSFHPRNWKGHTVLWLDERGKAGLVEPGTNQPRAEVRQLLAAGMSVFGVDLLYQGEFLKPGQSFEKTPRSKNPRDVPAYTFGYNHPVFAQRVHDVLTVRALVEADTHHRSRTFSLIAPGKMGPIAAAARFLLPEKVQAAVIESAGFRFEEVPDVQDPMFLPGAAKYGDLPALLGLGAPQPLLLLGEKEVPLTVQALYEGEGAAGKVEARANADLSSALTWLQSTLK